MGMCENRGVWFSFKPPHKRVPSRSQAAELLAAACRQEGTQVAQLGGLCVLGTERHEAEVCLRFEPVAGAAQDRPPSRKSRLETANCSACQKPCLKQDMSNRTIVKAAR